MKILHVDTQKGWRGGEQQLFWLVEGLIEKGVDSVVACKKNEELYLRCRQQGIKTFPLSGNQLLDSLKIGRYGKNFDIIHAHAAKAHTICAIAKIINKKNLVYTRRVDYKPRRNIMTNYKYGYTDKVVAISEFVANILKNSIKTKKTIDVIFSATDLAIQNRIDNEKISKIKKQYAGEPLIGTSAALTSQKNIPNLIKSSTFVIKQYKKARFIVMGEGKLRKELENLIESKHLEESFKLIGFKQDIENYIKALDVFVLPSNFEGLGSSILMAMVLKIPVVATDAGGIKEMIVDNKTGLLVPKNNPAALAKAIINIIENKKMSEELIENAYKLVKEKFSIEQMIKKYINLYEKLLNNVNL